MSLFYDNIFNSSLGITIFVCSHFESPVNESFYDSSIKNLDINDFFKQMKTRQRGFFRGKTCIHIGHKGHVWTCPLNSVSTGCSPDVYIE